MILRDRMMLQKAETTACRLTHFRPLPPISATLPDVGVCNNRHQLHCWGLVQVARFHSIHWALARQSLLHTSTSAFVWFIIHTRRCFVSQITLGVALSHNPPSAVPCFTRQDKTKLVLRCTPPSVVPCFTIHERRCLAPRSTLSALHTLGCI